MGGLVVSIMDVLSLRSGTSSEIPSDSSERQIERPSKGKIEYVLLAVPTPGLITSGLGEFHILHHVILRLGRYLCRPTRRDRRAKMGGPALIVEESILNADPSVN